MVRRRRWFLSAFAPTPEELDLEWLRMRLTIDLPPGQRAIAQALLIDAPEFEPPERPVTYDVVALAFGIQVTTVREHLRRIRQRHPELYAELMVERRRRFDCWHADVSRRRLERSRRWGKHRWALQYRAAHGAWPWLDCRDQALVHT
jgi:hypothetical protein